MSDVTNEILLAILKELIAIRQRVSPTGSDAVLDDMLNRLE